MRKLASIQRVLNVRPIEGADKIEVVDVIGWSVVVKKGEFQVGDLCVYFEIDSFIPDSHDCMKAEAFQDRMITWNGKRGMRLKTIKLRKQISQGLVLDIEDFPELTTSVRGTAVKEGDDVTEDLKIEKWEPVEETRSNGPNKIAGASTFPSFLRKTDQERVQNYMNELEKHMDETFEVTIKLDGSSMTVYHVGKDSPHYKHIAEDIEARQLRRKSFLQKLLQRGKKLLGLTSTPAFFTGVCSRNLEVGDDGNQFFNYAKEHSLRERLAKFGANIAIQGELIAPSIQQNHEKVAAPEFYVFNVFDIDNQCYLLPTEARCVVEQLGLDYVPVLADRIHLRWFSDPEGAGIEMASRELVEQILYYAEGPGMNLGVKREGVVFKSNDSEFSFKAISNSYLLKKEK